MYKPLPMIENLSKIAERMISQRDIKSKVDVSLDRSNRVLVRDHNENKIILPYSARNVRYVKPKPNGETTSVFVECYEINLRIKSIIYIARQLQCSPETILTQALDYIEMKLNTRQDPTWDQAVG